MSRREEREQAFYLVFEGLFNEDIAEALALYEESAEPVGEYASSLCKGVSEKAAELDECIAGFLKGWRIQRLPRVSLAILRLAVYEIKYVDDVPVSVAINEAVELAKTYAGREDASFVNGVLGAFARSLD